MEREEQERDRFATVDVLEEKRFPDFGSGTDSENFRKTQPSGHRKGSRVGVGNHLMCGLRLKESECMQAFGCILSRKFGLGLACGRSFLAAQKKQGKQDSCKKRYFPEVFHTANIANQGSVASPNLVNES